MASEEYFSAEEECEEEEEVEEEEEEEEEDEEDPEYWIGMGIEPYQFEPVPAEPPAEIPDEDAAQQPQRLGVLASEWWVALSFSQNVS